MICVSSWNYILEYYYDARTHEYQKMYYVLRKMSPSKSYNVSKRLTVINYTSSFPEHIIEGGNAAQPGNTCHVQSHYRDIWPATGDVRTCYLQ